MQSKQARNFSQKQRNYLLMLSGGKCQICGKDLDTDFHADHIIPYSKSGETSLCNGQALCQECNLKKGNRVMSSPTLREWQSDGIEKIKTQWEITNSKPLVAACPGAGKTILSVYAAHEAINKYDIEFIIIVSPSVNVREQWIKSLKKAGIKTHYRADNQSIKIRVDNNIDVREGMNAISITYAQLSKDPDLYVEICKRLRVLLIADEIHHADESACFGKALAATAEAATLRLSLSGTPFNTSGGSLAMCDSEVISNSDGKTIRRAKPKVTYEYSTAIMQNVCRPVEFVKVFGKSISTYKSLTNNKTFQKVIDLAKENNTDSIGQILDPQGEFFYQMANDALTALSDMKQYDKRAAMLVVAKDISHAGKLRRVLSDICHSNTEWSKFVFTEIYNDTTGAHDRIKAIKKDNTDVIITVRMISEGVDIKRLRVGLFATDFKTRMYFIQFVGRFVRWETRLDGMQYSKIIIPGHIKLIKYAREIERMIDSAFIPEPGPPPPPPPPEPTSEYIGTETEADETELIYRGKDEADRVLAERFFKKYPSLKGKIPESMAIVAAKEDKMDGFEATPEPSEKSEDSPKYWSNKNQQMASAVVRNITINGRSREELFKIVNGAANKKVGILKKDTMTPVGILKARYGVLLNWLKAIQSGQDWENVCYDN